MNSIDFALGTHTGLVRELNEDSQLALPKLGLWVIADGMGRHEAGEVASGIAIRGRVRPQFYDSLKKTDGQYSCILR